MKRFLLICTVFALTLTASTAFAQHRPTVPSLNLDQFEKSSVDQVKLLLSAYHELPGKSVFEEVPQSKLIIDALAVGPDGFLRDRALQALSYWPSADVFLIYAGIVSNPNARYGTRHRTVVLIANSFGDRALPVLEPLLTDSDLQIRLTAIQAVGSIHSDASMAMLDRVADTETHPVALSFIDKHARQIK